MKQSKILVISLITIAAIVIGIICLLNHAPSGMHDGIITIRPGMNLHQTAYYLKSKNIITSASFFIAMGRLLNETNVIAGNYRIYEGENSFSILHKITRGRFITKNGNHSRGFYHVLTLLHCLIAMIYVQKVAFYIMHNHLLLWHQLEYLLPVLKGIFSRTPIFCRRIVTLAILLSALLIKQKR